MTTSRYAILAAASVVSLSGCGSDSSVGPHRLSGIQFLSGDHQSDTISATPVAPLILTIRDSAGHLAPLGTVVRFTGIVRPAPASSPFPNYPLAELTVRGPTADAYTQTATGETDASGRIAVSVQFGVIAGAGRLAVDVPTLGLSDTARFTILPGSPTQLVIGPLDTMMYVGTTFQFRGGAADQYGNIRDTTATWSSTTLPVDTDGTVHPSAIGRYEVVATVGATQHSAWISVVPRGRIVALSGANLVTFELDGSHFDTVASTPLFGDAPRWIPGSDKILYANANRILNDVDTLGTTGVFFDPAPTTFMYASEAQPTSQGNWVYFGAIDAACTGSTLNPLECLYRAKSDGSSIQRIGTHVQQDGTMFSPAPSPDGSKVAFVTDSAGYSVIRVLTVATDVLDAPITLGVNPAWSPTGTRIAFLSSFDGSLKTMNADGSGVDVVRPVRYYQRQPIAWSPDGAWIIMIGDSGLEIVNMTTGLTLPLKMNGVSLLGPSWR